MNLVLKVYTDDSLTELKRVVEADRLKIPYRVATTVAESLDTVDINNNDQVLSLITGNVVTIDKIIKATFGVSDSELECIDAGELGAVAVELYKWAIAKLKGLRGGAGSKN